MKLKSLVGIVVLSIFGIFLGLFLLGVSVFGFEKVKVPQGYVALRYNTIGNFKSEVLGSGYKISRPGTDIVQFPTFQQTYVYTKSADEGNVKDESFNFSLAGGVRCAANIAVNYHIEPTKAADIYVKYRTDLSGITATFLRSSIRDAFNNIATRYQVDSMMFGSGKAGLLSDVKNKVNADFNKYGIIIDNIQLASDFEYPPQITEGIVAKNKAIQDAQIQENNARTSIAKAKADSIAAEGAAKVKIAEARGDSASSVISAKGEAEAIRAKKVSLTPAYIDYIRWSKWNGELPGTLGGFSLLRDMK